MSHGRGFVGSVAAVAGTGPLVRRYRPFPGPPRPGGACPTGRRAPVVRSACVEALPGGPVVKPQVAFFERWGSAGIDALESVMAAARGAGLLVIADAKRGDIGSTMEAYASAWLDPGSPLVVDAVTVNPYLGVGALRPALDLAARHRGGG